MNESKLSINNNTAAFDLGAIKGVRETKRKQNSLHAEQHGYQKH